MNKIPYLAVFFLLIFFVPGCSDDDDEEILIEFAEFKLDEGCDWHAVPEEEKVYVIHSAEEMRKLVRCDEIPGLDDIDFEKNTLLLVVGEEKYKNWISEIVFIQTNKDKYKLNVIFEPNLAAAFNPWEVALLVPKLHKKAKIKFVKDYTLFN